MTENKSSKQVVRELKVEYAVKQKKGLPFIMASAALWTIIPIVSLLLGMYFSQVVVCLAFVLFDLLICVLLCLENKQAGRTWEAINREKD